MARACVIVLLAVLCVAEGLTFKKPAEKKVCAPKLSKASTLQSSIRGRAPSLSGGA